MSLTSDHRIDEELIVTKSVESGVIPAEVRYDVINDAYRGVVKSSNDLLYYFHFVPGNDSFKMVRASDPAQVYEADQLLTKCVLGCNLIKAGDGGDKPAGMNTVEEEADIQDQNELITDRHPAAAMISTPDDPAQGRMWHEQEVPPMTKSWDAGSLLSGLNDSLRKSTQSLRRPISDKEHQFMVEVLGRTPDQLNRGDVYMNPTQKVMYQQWLNKSMRSKVGGLTKWLKK